MTKLQAENEFKQTLLDTEGCKTFGEIKARYGLTTLKCMWVDFVDMLNKDQKITDKQAFQWGQPSYLCGRK